ncbi:DNA polymerase II [Candidatus Woesearchaeota archaeon]|nr:DNA polymerase II [Candidatus Woesearchaeota archaeon]
MTLGIIITKNISEENSNTFIEISGRLNTGEKTFLKIPYKPYFFIRESDSITLKLDYKKTELKTFSNDSVAKLEFDNYQKFKDFEKKLIDAKVELFESDVTQTQAFSNALNIGSIVDFNDETVVPVETRDVDEFKKQLIVVAIDIETNYKTREILSVSFASNKNHKKVFVTQKSNLNYVVTCDNELDLLKKIIDYINEVNPDVITGWNVIDFDLAEIKSRCDFYKIPFSIGCDNSELRIIPKKSFLADSSAKAKGRQILDGMQLARQAFVKLSDYKLDTAAEEILGDSKVELDEGHKGEVIIDMYKNNTDKFIEYNLKDSELVLKILDKKGLLDIALERSLITGIELDRVKSAVATMESLYIKSARKRGYVLNNIGKNLKLEGISGGFVLTSKPGLFDYILVFDYKSLYPSLMRTFNIDLLSSAQAKSDVIKAPNGARFSKTVPGILPELIEMIWSLRDKAKKEKNAIKSYALKVTMNSFFGVLANPNCRYFNYDVADSITNFGRSIIKESIEKIEEKGFSVIYGDTDSLFVKSNCKSVAEANAFGTKISNELNIYFKEKIQTEYNRGSVLELEFEKIYKKFFMPKIRGSESGAKKRYAGLLVKGDKDELDITGLEFVRSDWTELARNFQYNLLTSIFNNKPHRKFIKDLISDLKSGKLDDELLYRKKLTKPPEEYTKTTPPHVKAARLLAKLDSNIVWYAVTTEGPIPKELLVEKKYEYDYDHYIEKQIKPIADAILSMVNESFDDILSGNVQSTLMGF